MAIGSSSDEVTNEELARPRKKRMGGLGQMLTDMVQPGNSFSAKLNNRVANANLVKL